MKTLVRSTQFKKDVKAAKKRGQDMEILKNTILMLLKDEVLPESYRDHQLTGNYKAYRECHMQPDWLLIYQKEDDMILFYRTGTHSELFR